MQLVYIMQSSWQHPFTACISGPTSSGKTEFVKKLLINADLMIDKKITEIIWCYGEAQVLHNKIKEATNIPIQFFAGIPDINEISQECSNDPKLIILDDLMSECTDQVTNLFTKGSHHRNLSVILITQNVFHQGRGKRDIALNTQYLVMFKNVRDKAEMIFFFTTILSK